MKHSLADTNVAAKISADDAAKVQEAVEAALRYVQTNQVGRGMHTVACVSNACLRLVWNGA